MAECIEQNHRRRNDRKQRLCLELAADADDREFRCDHRSAFQNPDPRSSVDRPPQRLKKEHDRSLVVEQIHIAQLSLDDPLADQNENRRITVVIVRVKRTGISAAKEHCSQRNQEHSDGFQQ